MTQQSYSRVISLLPSTNGRDAIIHYGCSLPPLLLETQFTVAASSVGKQDLEELSYSQIQQGQHAHSTPEHANSTPASLTCYCEQPVPVEDGILDSSLLAICYHPPTSDQPDLLLTSQRVLMCQGAVFPCHSLRPTPLIGQALPSSQPAAAGPLPRPPTIRCVPRSRQVLADVRGDGILLQHHLRGLVRLLAA